MTLREKIVRYRYVLLLFLCFAAYGSTLKNQFTYDDVFTVRKNYFILSFANIPKMFTPDYFRLSQEASFRPVVTLTYFTDHFLFRENPAGFHLTNLLLHTVNTFLLCFVLGRIFGPQTSFLLAVIFAVTPVNAETVNAVSFREDLLVLFWTMLAWWGYLSYRERGRRPVVLALSVAAYLLAFFSKENGFLLPVLFLLYEYLIGDRHRRIPWFGVPFRWYLAVGAAGAWMRFFVFSNAGGPTAPYIGGSIVAAALTAPLLMGRYLLLLLVPYPLMAEYPPVTPAVFPLGEFWFSCSFAMVMIASCIAAWRFDRRVFFACAWFLAGFLPIANLVPLFKPFAERYMYIPGIGIYLLIILLVVRPRIERFSIPLMLAAALLFLSVTVNRNNDWYDDESLWSAVLRYNAESPGVYSNLGYAFWEKKEYAKALACYDKALELDPYFETAYVNRALAYTGIRDFDRATADYNRALALNNDLSRSADAYNGLAGVMMRQRDFKKAIAIYNKAIRLRPDSAELYCNRANARVEEGDAAGAVEDYSRALLLNSSHVRAYNNRGLVRLKRGEFDAALRDFNAAIRINPSYVRAYQNRASLLMMTGDREGAARDLQRIRVLGYEPSAGVETRVVGQPTGSEP